MRGCSFQVGGDSFDAKEGVFVGEFGLVRSVVVGEGFDGCGVVDRAVFPSWIGS